MKCFGPTVRQKKNVDWLLSELTLNGVEVYIIHDELKRKGRGSFDRLTVTLSLFSLFRLTYFSQNGNDKKSPLSLGR